MKHLLLAIIAVAFCLSPMAQTVTDLYNQKNFPAVIKFENKADSLSAEELYMVGFAFFQSENDSMAIEFYNKAIDKGLNNGSVHFFKVLSLRFLQKNEEALKEIDLALQLEPDNQEFMNEKGMVCYALEQYSKALEIFETVKKLSPKSPEPLYWIPRILYDQGNFEKALADYYEAVHNLPKENRYYIGSLMEIGLLEFNKTKNYQQSANAYEQILKLDSERYEFYYLLMKSYNAGKEYNKADSIFAIVKGAFNHGKLPKEDMDFKAVTIAQFDWNGQIAMVRKSLVDAVKTLDITYKVFLYNKKGDEVERRFVVEKTFEFVKDSAKFLLCEQNKKTGGHITYPYGWVAENIPLDDLEKSIRRILDKTMNAAASSNFNNN